VKQDGKVRELKQGVLISATPRSDVDVEPLAKWIEIAPVK